MEQMAYLSLWWSMDDLMLFHLSNLWVQVRIGNVSRLTRSYRGFFFFFFCFFDQLSIMLLKNKKIKRFEICYKNFIFCVFFFFFFFLSPISG